MKKIIDRHAAKEVFKIMEREECRQITFHYNPKTNLKVVWVVDSVPELRDRSGKLRNDVSASGGTRFAHSDPDAALDDALRLSRAMTRKAKVLGVNEGGCKAVVLANQKKSARFLKSIGDFIQIHKGFFKTAIDLGFLMKDGEKIASQSDYIDSLSHLQKGLGSTGENTAEGLIYGYEVICDKILRKPLKDCSITVQGLGAVGFPLAERLIKKGCKVIGTDIIIKNCMKAEKIGVKIVLPDEILKQNIDIFAPCAYGGVVDRKTIPTLRCKVIAGGANNPLENEFEDEKRLLKRGIMYIPDFVINSAGFLQALVERGGGTVGEARKRSAVVGTRLKEVINYSRRNKCTLLQAATRLFDR